MSVCCATPSAGGLSFRLIPIRRIGPCAGPFDRQECLRRYGAQQGTGHRAKGRVAVFAGDYAFRYGAMELLRDGSDGAILAMGAMAYRAVEAWEIARLRL